MSTRIDPSGMPDGLRAGVERAAKLLEIELEKLSPYVIEADWRLGSLDDGARAIWLTLTVQNELEPVTYCTPFLPDYFSANDPESQRKSLKSHVSRFIDLLWDALRKDVRQLRNRLSDRLALVGEG